ncbi:MAG: hypothetical protein IT285_06810 [Bdellovibrionales bacterium]|nr:hypothetical protein [Bdellovibrionales bacterium]
MTSTLRLQIRLILSAAVLSLALVPRFASAAPEYRVARVVDAWHVQVEGKGDAGELGDHWVIRARNEDGSYREVCIALAERIEEGRVLLRLKLHYANGMVVVGDFAQRLNVRDAEARFKGRVDLQIDGAQVSARYKPLVYQGMFLPETAATLSEGEHLVDVVGAYQYGFTNGFAVGTNVYANVLGVANLRAKAKVYRSPNFDVAQSVIGVYDVRFDLGYNLRFTTHVDIRSNSRILSHVAFNILTGSQASAESGLFQSSIESGYEIVLDNWDRLLLGPSYNFASQAVGGYLSYMWLWNRIHLALGIQTRNLANFEFDAASGYSPTFSLFIRL